MGDDAKRRAFAAAAHASVQARTWPALCAELVRHYDGVMAESASPAARTGAPKPWGSRRLPA